MQITVFRGVLLFVVPALLGAAIWQGIVRPLEEAELEASFGAEYARYRDEVRCWIPRTRPYRGGPALQPAEG